MILEQLLFRIETRNLFVLVFFFCQANINRSALKNLAFCRPTSKDYYYSFHHRMVAQSASCSVIRHLQSCFGRFSLFILFLFLKKLKNQWGTGTRETEVRLDGWCEGGLRQQRNDGGGYATMRERSERTDTNVTE